MGEASISLDSVDELGTFVEIEVIAGPDDANPTGRIEKIAQEIGVEGEPILASYLELLLSKRSAPHQ
jgi:adenylate cyclase class 2